MEEKATSASKVSDRKSASEALEKLTSLAFVATLIVLGDMFARFKSYSLFAQTVNTDPWEVLEAENALLRHFWLVGRKALDAEDRDDLPPGEEEEALNEKKVLEPADFPRLFVAVAVPGSADTTVHAELCSGRYRGITLQEPLKNDDKPEEGTYTAKEYMEAVLVDEVRRKRSHRMRGTERGRGKHAVGGMLRWVRVA